MKSQAPPLAYEETGDGDAFVFVHGLGSSRRQTAALLGAVPGHRLIAPDALGHGASPATPADVPYTFDRLGDAVVSLLDHLEVGTCILGGLSMGAAASLNVAARHPGRVRALVLVRPAWLDTPHPDNLAIIARLGRWIEAHGLDGARTRLAEDADFQAIHALDRAAAASITGALDAPGAATRGRVLHEMVASAPIRALDDLATVAIPALVLGTDVDPLHPTDMARRTADALPRATHHDTPPRYVQPQRHTDHVRHLIRDSLDALTSPDPNGTSLQS